MTNIYVSPLASPSFECLSGAADPPTDEFLKTGEDKQEVRVLDENANDIFETAKKTNGIMKGTGHAEFGTPSGKITISVSPAGTPESSSPRSPVYCFHSFTYGVGGSKGNVADLNDGEKTTAELNGIAVSDWEDKSFDADSPNVWRTRTVVDPVDDVGSPSILCKWNTGETAEYLSTAIMKSMDEFYSVSDSLSSKETSLSEPSKANQSEIYVDLQNLEAGNANGTEEMTTGKGPALPTRGTGHSTDGSCDKVAKTPTRRLSPEGAECFAVDVQMLDATGDATGYLKVPETLVVPIQRRNLAGSPSGQLVAKDYWMWDDVVEARETVDSDFQDQLPLLGPEKPHFSYKTECLGEAEKGAPVTCFPCRHCVIL